MPKSTTPKAPKPSTSKQAPKRSTVKATPTRSPRTAAARAKTVPSTEAGRLGQVKASVKHALENAEHGVEIAVDKVTDTLNAHKPSKASNASKASKASKAKK